MNNAFFRIALAKAFGLLGNRGRLLILTAQLAAKTRTVKWSKAAFSERLFLFGRLLKAFATRRYRSIPVKSLLWVTAAIIYFINPLDLVPDAVIGLGFTDDLAILTGVFNLVSKEVEKFREWESSNVLSFI